METSKNSAPASTREARDALCAYYVLRIVAERAVQYKRKDAPSLDTVFELAAPWLVWNREAARQCMPEPDTGNQFDDDLTVLSSGTKRKRKRASTHDDDAWPFPSALSDEGDASGGDRLSQLRSKHPKVFRALLDRSVKALGVKLPAVQHIAFPAVHVLASVLGLHEMERAVLMFAATAQLNRDFKRFLRDIHVCGDLDAREQIGNALGFDAQEFAHGVSTKSRMYQMGFFTPERDTLGGDLEDYFQLKHNFTAVLALGRIGPQELLDRFAQAAPEPKLTVADMPHLAGELELLASFLRRAVATKARGTHILLYGPPGTGKTEFARLLAKLSGVRLLEVAGQDEDGDAADRKERFGFLQITQHLFAEAQNTCVLLDEAEDVFPGDGASAFARLFGMRGRSSGDSIGKAWVNQVLEKNPVPVIWISNRIDQIDEAYLRRFSYHLAFNTPPRPVRRKIAAHYLAEHAPEQGADTTLLDSLSADATVTPAQIESAVRFATLCAEGVRQTPPKVEAGVEQPQFPALVMRQLRRSALAMGHPRPATVKLDLSYNPEFLNLAGTTPAMLEQALRNLTRQNELGAPCRASLCFYGRSGTGKTAFARHLADQLGRELIVKSGADLLSKWVGETESNIRAVFDEISAAPDRYVLLLDEADALLADRSVARASWEVSMVNQFLCQMEQFEGVFICATNLFRNLDSALLRRFLFKVEFLPLSGVQREAIFRQLFPFLAGGDSWKDELSGLHGLTPGDFANVRRQLELQADRDERNDERMVLQALAKELRDKGAWREGRACGFTAGI